MSSPATSTSSGGVREGALTPLARAGFGDLTATERGLADLAEATGLDAGLLRLRFSETAAAEPDAALAALCRIAERTSLVGRALADPAWAARLLAVLGASSGLAEFLIRHPGELSALAAPLVSAPEQGRLDADLAGAATGEAPRRALRIRYRHWLLRIAAWDLEQPSGLAAVEPVSGALADLAGAALGGALAVARREAAARGSAQAAAVPLAIVGMGKAGARELNYVSDVDVIFVTEPTDAVPDPVPVATRLAVTTMRVLDDADVEPALWQVDANLRPEGRDGPLVRTIESHARYYERWAKGWEFQALLKARPLAGDAALGTRFCALTAERVWQASAQPDFVENVQRMRRRVEEHLPADRAPRELKLGAGGLRDIEFTVQLLQLVHGRTDAGVRQRATLPALRALAEAGYVGRLEAAEFGEAYRMLRLLEHRLQLRRLTRTHLMPSDDAELRVLARASRLAPDAAALTARWQHARQAVRGLHQRLFYRPLLSAVARLPDEDLQLSSAAAEARLASIGFRDPRGALAHIAALTEGVSRRAAIQRTLLPVLLQWFAEGADPDLGLLAFRRLSERLGETAWYLRLLRDSTVAARRLASVLSGSRFVTGLLETNPEAVAWLERDADLRPRPRAQLRTETTATVLRYPVRDEAAAALRQARRREVLRLALGALVGALTVQELGPALAYVTTALLAGCLRSVRRDEGPWPEFAIVAMGRFGGAEMSFGSDADVIAVFRPLAGMAPEAAQKQAELLVAEVRRLSTDPRLPLDLDFDLRPEGRNGPIVRSIRAYEAYYARWSLTWESQALLRARGVVGDRSLVEDFTRLADRMRYPEHLDDAAVREIRRIKARIEAERLPRAADPGRHLKLGPGGLSDVEWVVQLVQLQHAARVPALRTTSTLGALDVAVAQGLVPRADGQQLRATWLLISRVRSAITLWTNRSSDLLPSDRAQLEGIARVLEYPGGSATLLEEDVLREMRRARAVYARLFMPTPPARGYEA